MITTKLFLPLFRPPRELDAINSKFLTIKLEDIGFSEVSIDLIGKFVINKQQKKQWPTISSLIGLIYVKAFIGPINLNSQTNDLKPQLLKYRRVFEYADDAIVILDNGNPELAISKVEHSSSILSRYFKTH